MQTITTISLHLRQKPDKYRCNVVAGQLKHQMPGLTNFVTYNTSLQQQQELLEAQQHQCKQQRHQLKAVEQGIPILRSDA